MEASMTKVVDFAKVADQARGERIEQALDVLYEVLVPYDGHFLDREEAIAELLCVLGRGLTRRSLEDADAQLPNLLEHNGVSYQRGRQRKDYRIGTPFGTVLVDVRRYKPLNPIRPDALDDDTVRPHNTLISLNFSIGLFQGMTPRLTELVAAFEVNTVSREAFELMTLAGLSPPSRANLEKKAHAVGLAFAERTEHELAESRRATPLPAEVHSVTVGVDRVSVAYKEATAKRKPVKRKEAYVRAVPPRYEVKWHMDYVANVSFRDAKGKLLHSYQYSQAYYDDVDTIVGWAMDDVVWALAIHPSLKVAFCLDGARDLWGALWKAKDARSPLADVEVHAVVDWYHLMSYLDGLKRSLKWKSAYVTTLKDALRSEPFGIEAIYDAAMHALDKPKLSTSAQKSIHAFCSYVEGRMADQCGVPHLFNYVHQAENGLPIGSGSVEATAKSLVTLRFKRAGCRWTAEGSCALHALVSLRKSHQRWKPAFRRFISSLIYSNYHDVPTNLTQLHPANVTI